MKLKVMTFNVRCDVKGDGINYFPNRQHRVLEAIREEAPDLIGFQEVTDYIRAFLKTNLSDEYTVVGCGRNPNYGGEACLIAFRKDVFDLIRFETRFLSTAPFVAGSTYGGSDQSHCPRTFAHAELIHKEMDHPIHFINTHLDHKGTVARLMGMTQILQRISELSGQFVLTGDMNVPPDSDCAKLPLAVKERKITDATAAVPFTFHAYGKREPFSKIDYIYTDGEPLDAYAVKDEPTDGVYISDHYPVCAWIELT